MLVAEWMSRAPVTISQDAPISEAAALMVRNRIRRIPVVITESSTRLMGMVTKSDVLRASPATLNPFSAVAPDAIALSTPVRGVMSLAPTTTIPAAPLELAAQIMLERKVGGLPVLLNGQLIGMLTRSDIFRAFTAALGGRGDGLRITFDVGPNEDVVSLVADLAKRHHLRVTSVATFVRGGVVGEAKSNQETAVVRLSGPPSPSLVEELWRTGHRVQSVLLIGADGKPIVA